MDKGIGDNIMIKDLVVIGGGPGGYVAAIRAAKLGANVCIIEKDKLGGTCLNRGCIPTKALYRNAELLNTLKEIDKFGITVNSYSVNVEKIQERKNTIVNQLVSGVHQLLKGNKVEILLGTGTLLKSDLNSKNDEKHILVSLIDGNTLEITAKNVIIATGSKPIIPPIEGADDSEIYTSEDILNFNHIPKTLAIIGGGVIGMEFACIFNALGSKVTILEYLPTILVQLDTDITKRLSVSLKKRGIDVNTSVKVTKIEKNSQGYVVYGEGKKGEISVNAEKVLISTGRVPVTDNLGLESLGIEFDRKGIKVDSNYMTNIDGIYAIGDVNGEIMLAHAASHQGDTVAKHIMGINNSKDYHTVVPGCVFIFPEVAYAGITEQEAKEKGLNYQTSRFMFGANGKALALGEGEGFVKVISCDNVLVGVHIMGPHASDLVHEGTLAITNNMNIESIINTIHAHPTLSEAFVEAVLGLNGEAIHMK